MNRERNVRWILVWPTQEIVKEVDGELREVTVIGGYAGHIWLDEAEEHQRSLEEFWPGLRSQIISVERPEELPGILKSRGLEEIAVAEEMEEDDSPDESISIAR